MDVQLYLQYELNQSQLLLLVIHFIERYVKVQDVATH